MNELLFGQEDWRFLGAVALRTAVMFIVILGGLRVMGKRGISHLSVFELGVIVGLGSAAGDPMFYKDVGLLQGLVVFGVVLGLYRVLEWVLNRSERAAERLEGRPIEVLCDGALVAKEVANVEITTPELFTQLRVQSVSHLGQIERAIVEPNGAVSIYYFTDDKVKPGLPIIPGLFDQRVETIADNARYSCAHCGHTGVLETGEPPACPACSHREWVRSLSGPRVR